MRFQCCWQGYMLTCDLGGTVKTPAFPREDQAILPVHLPAKTAPTTGHGTMDWAAVLLTSQLITPLPLSAATAGPGPTALFAATLLQPLPNHLDHLLHLVNPESLLVTTMTSPMGTNALAPKSASTVLVTSPLALRASLPALFPV